MKSTIEGAASVAIEISELWTKLLRIQAIGDACLVDDFLVTESILRRERKTLLVDEEKLAVLLQKLGSRAIVSVVLHDPQSFNMMFRVPVATEDQIREFVRVALRRTHQIELSQFRWSIIAAADQTSIHEGITAPVSKAKNVLISGTSKRLVELVTDSFKKHGIAIENILFPVACQLRAFQLYGGALLGNETICLLHAHQGSFSAALFRGGLFVAYKDFTVDEGTNHVPVQTLKQIHAFLREVEEKTGVPIKCTFITSATSQEEQLVSGLKQLGRYARTWNAPKKLPVAGGRTLPEPLDSVGTQLNNVLGAALIGAERHSTHPSETTLNLAEAMVRPLCVVACVLTLTLGHLLFRTFQVNREIAEIRKELKGKENTKGPVNELAAATAKIEELDAFSDARRTWSAILSEVIRLEVKGVNVLQVYGAGGTTPLERQPFTEKSTSAAKRKNSSRFVVEADNVAGLKSLEEFIDSIQANTAISSMLDQRTPVRLLGHYQSSEDPSVTRVSVEYRLNEKLF